MAKKIRNAKVIKTLILFSFLLLLICIININYILYLADKYNISIRVVSQFLTQLQFYSQNGDPFSYRLDLLRFSLSLIAKSYLLGIGAGGDSFYIMNAGLPGNTHNWLLEVFVNFGIFIFILYIFIIVDLLYRLKKIFSASNLSYEIRSIALALFLGLIIIPINGMIVSSLIKVNFFWIFYGIVVAFCDKYFYEQGNIKYV
ncbi:MAG: O-antigen ligase family protein [Nitrososphaerota archaeon]